MTDAIDRLFRAITDASDADPALWRTVKLRREGVPKMAKKVAEEAAEVAIEAVAGSRETLVRESADLIYNLVVLWTATGLSPQDVYAEMERRERLYGIAQKLPKSETVEPLAYKPARPMKQDAARGRPLGKIAG